MRNVGILAGLFSLGAACLGACASDGGGGQGAGGRAGSGAGGTTASGGASTGGTTATGGTTPSGGTTSAGGTTVAGGATASGGKGGGTGGAAVSSGGNGAGGGSATGGSTKATGGSGTGGAKPTGGSGPGTGGATAMGGSTGAAGSTGGLPPLKVNGTKLQDPNGKTIILRGTSLMDIGQLYVQGSSSIKGITDRIDKLVAAGVQGHVVRFPVYPKIDYNAGSSYCSALPYPIGGTGTNANCKAATGTLSAADYVAKVLAPAIDYATSKNLYVIIDHHQIDDVIAGSSNSVSADDATAFWADIAPKFASYSNVLYEPYNEPISGTATWTRIKPVVQGWIDTIRKAGADNVIIVPSNSYCQRPGDAASDPPTDPKSNLMYTAHIYPGNWNDSFKKQVATAVTKAPVFITEWGYMLNSNDSVLGTMSATWGTDLQALVDGNGASWTAWISDNSWTPNMFSDSAITKLTEFGTLVKTWLAAKANSDWVQ